MLYKSVIVKACCPPWSIILELQPTTDMTQCSLITLQTVRSMIFNAALYSLTQLSGISNKISL